MRTAPRPRAPWGAPPACGGPGLRPRRRPVYNIDQSHVKSFLTCLIIVSMRILCITGITDERCTIGVYDEDEVIQATGQAEVSELADALDTTVSTLDSMSKNEQDHVTLES